MLIKKTLPLLLLLFTITACTDDAGGPSDEGTKAAPVNIGTAPVTYPGSVAAASPGGDGYSYYVVTLPLAGTGYTITMTGLSADADIAIYSDPAFTQQVGGSQEYGTADELTGYTSLGAGQMLYIEVQNYDANGTEFTLAVQQRLIVQA